MVKERVGDDDGATECAAMVPLRMALGNAGIVSYNGQEDVLVMIWAGRAYRVNVEEL